MKIRVLLSEFHKMTSQDCVKFWDLVENKFGCSVPKYVKNILALQGFDNALSIKTLSEGDFEFLEKYAKNDMSKRIPLNADLSDYYGTFSEAPQDFVFLLGHRRLLEEIVAGLNKTIATKGYDVFSIHKNKIQMIKTKTSSQNDKGANTDSTIYNIQIPNRM